MYKRRCPKCEKEMERFPALSRIDNKTEICEMCGTEEAINDAMGYEKKPIKYKTVQTILVRKPANTKWLIEDAKDLITRFHEKPKTYRIVKTIELDFVEFISFSQNLLKDSEIIKENKDLCYYPDEVLEIKEKGSTKTGLLVHPQGSNYCRYAGVEIQKMEIEEFMKKVTEADKKRWQEEEKQKLQEMIKMVEAHGYKCVVKKEDE